MPKTFAQKLQEPLVEIKRIWEYLASIDGREPFQPQERFMATIIAGFPVPQASSIGSSTPMSGNSPDYTDARYCVVRVLAYQSNVNDLPPLGVDADSANSGIADSTYLTATNLCEVLAGNAHLLPTDGSMTVEVFATWDVGSPQQKHYFFAVMPNQITWIACTSPMPPASLGSDIGGGAYYNAIMLAGAPVTIDPLTNLVIPLTPGEKYSALTSGLPTVTILAENSAEPNQGNPPSHWVPCGTFFGGAPDPTLAAAGSQLGGASAAQWFPAYYTGMSNETPPRPTYRFFCPMPGVTDIQIDGSQSIYVSSTAILGSGRYIGATVQGSGHNVDPTTAFTAGGGPGLLDPGFSANRTTTLIPNGTLCAFCNLFESGKNSVATTYPNVASKFLGDGKIVQGSFRGMMLYPASTPISSLPTLIPMFYGYAAPTAALFPVLLSVQSGGNGGTDSALPTWTYTMGPIGGINGSGIGYSNTTYNYTPQSPIYGRGGSFPYQQLGYYEAATCGLAYIDYTGMPQLFVAFELPSGFTGTKTISGTSLDIVGGRIQS